MVTKEGEPAHPPDLSQRTSGSWRGWAHPYGEEGKGGRLAGEASTHSIQTASLKEPGKRLSLGMLSTHQSKQNLKNTSRRTPSLHHQKGRDAKVTLTISPSEKDSLTPASLQLPTTPPS